MRALVRGVPDSFGNALSAKPRAVPIDVALAREQVATYRELLQALGLIVTSLAADDRFPDCVFVEDTALVANDLALIARPGAPARRGETAAVADALAPYVELAYVTEPATLDGGDCMRLGSTIYVGRSARSNAGGIAAIDDAFTPRGFRVVAVDLPPGVLHLKCVCSPLADDRVLLARGTLAESVFDAAIVWVHADETYAANAVAVGGHVLVAAGFPRTHAALVEAGFAVRPIPTSEVQKADGSLTCQSILF